LFELCCPEAATGDFGEPVSIGLNRGHDLTVFGDSQGNISSGRAKSDSANGWRPGVTWKVGVVSNENGPAGHYEAENVASTFRAFIMFRCLPVDSIRDDVIESRKGLFSLCRRSQE
jgi:hypothetical protein